MYLLVCPNGLITLLTDFGLQDVYVGVMKGVILGIFPEAKVVDISHGTPKYDIVTGAFMLADACRQFPLGTVHVAVVDPEVGSRRNPIIVESRRSYFVGPDNGLLSMASQTEGIVKIVRIENAAYMLRDRSGTFDGRDVFSPASAYLAKGTPLDNFGPRINSMVEMTLPKPKFSNRSFSAHILHVDGFGNIVTDISSKALEDLGFKGEESLLTTVGRTTLSIPFRPTYSEVPVGSLVLIVGSHGFLEIAVNQGSAASALGARVGMKLKLRMGRRLCRSVKAPQSFGRRRSP